MKFGDERIDANDSVIFCVRRIRVYIEKGGK